MLQRNLQESVTGHLRQANRQVSKKDVLWGSIFAGDNLTGKNIIGRLFVDLRLMLDQVSNGHLSYSDRCFLTQNERRRISWTFYH